MPLLDHFHPPVSERRNWEGFHGLWAAAMVEKLNRDLLAEEYFADMHIHIGSQLEIDVATPEEPKAAGPGSRLFPAPQTVGWTPPPTDLVMPAVFPDDIEVQVFATTAGATLVAAIELVSPGNKDRPETRRAFAAKCVSYLTRGIGLVIVDVVTNRLANLHNEVVALLEQEERFTLAPTVKTYAVAYRPSRCELRDQIEVWPGELQLGKPLPILPLALRNAGVVPLDLEATYSEACRRSRLKMAA